jgi:tetratricopeptide (TPR) repeat protein
LRVFISYSHADRKLKDQLLEHLTVAERFRGVHIWTDDQISPGANWREELDKAMGATDVALLLVSASFLASKFINDVEIPGLLKRQSEVGLVVIPILLKTCDWASHPAIGPFQALPKGSTPITRYTGDKRQQAFKEVASSIALLAKRRAEDSSSRSSSPPAPVGRRPDEAVPVGHTLAPPRDEERRQVRWSSTGERSRRAPLYFHPLPRERDFIGRERELARLKELYERDQSLVVAMIGIGGTGKSVLLQQFVKRLEADTATSPAALFVWSFFADQNADHFFKEAYRYLTGNDSPATASLGHAYALADALRGAGRVVLVLDGLERAQEDTRPSFGRIHDPSLRFLLELIAHGCGRTFALATSRFPVTDLDPFRTQGYHELTLPQLEPAAAVELLMTRGAHGEESVLRALVQRFGGHALTVSLLGSAIHDFFDGSAAQAIEADDFAGLELLDQSGKLAGILTDYERRLSADAVALLELMSAFTGGVRRSLLEAICLGEGKGGDGGLLAARRPMELRAILGQLEKLRLVERVPRPPGAGSPSESVFMLHAVIKDYFYHRLLRRGAASVHASIRDYLASAPMIDRPKTDEELGLVEELIHHTRRVGQMREAFVMYGDRMDSYEYLGERLGEHARGARILRGFFVDGDVARPYPGVPQSSAAEDLGLYLVKLGELDAAAACHGVSAGSRDALRNLFKVRLLQGRLPEAKGIALNPIADASRRPYSSRAEVDLGDAASSEDPYLAAVCTLLGKIKQARAIFTRCSEKLESPYTLMHGLDTVYYGDFLLRTGELGEVRRISERALDFCERAGSYNTAARFRLLLAEASRLRGERGLALQHFEAVLKFAELSGWQEAVAATHLAAGRAHLHVDLEAASSAVESGIRIAERCGFGVLGIDLLVLRAEIQLACGDERAEATSRQALRLATEESCAYAWGQADASDALGRILIARGNPADARAMLRLALTQREELEDPRVVITRRALAVLE